MSHWQEHSLQDKITEILHDVRTRQSHPFGTPYLTAYQLAIELARRYPAVVAVIGHPLGGAGVGQRNSLAQYLGRELSRRIGANPAFPIEGAFLADQDVESISYIADGGERVVSSLTGSGFDLSIFRLRA